MIKEIDDELYDVVSSWWADGYTFPKDMLPRHSYVVFKDDKPVVSGILYKEEMGKFAMLGWMIANPDSTREDRDECIDRLLDHLFEQAEKEGIKPILGVFNHRRVIEKLKSRGFSELTNESTQLLKVI